MPQSTEISSSEVLTAIVVQLLCSTLIGMLCGFALSAAMKHMAAMRHHSIYQTALVALCGYLSYAIAEALTLSGIFTLFVCALVLSHYCFHSLSRVAQVATKISFASVADMAEGFAFAYVGMSLWAYSIDTGLDVVFTMYMLVVLLLGRLVCVLVLSACYARCGVGTDSLSLREQLAFTLAGSVRGSLCWAQALQVDCAQIFTTALLLVMLTTVLGGVLLPLALPSLLAASPSTSTTADGPSMLQYQPIPDRPSKWAVDEEVKETDYGTLRSVSEISETATLRTTPCKLIQTLPRGTSGGGHMAVPPRPVASAAPRAGWLSRLFLYWVYVDETILKPLFGGSQTDSRRRQLLRSMLTASAMASEWEGLGMSREEDYMQSSILTEDSMISVQDEAIRDYFAGSEAVEEPTGRSGRRLFSPESTEGLRMTEDDEDEGEGGDGDADDVYLSRMSQRIQVHSPSDGLQLLAATPSRGEESDSWLEMSTLSHLHSGRQPRAPLPSTLPHRPLHGAGRPVYPAGALTPYNAEIGRLSDNSLLSPIPKTNPHDL